MIQIANFFINEYIVLMTSILMIYILTTQPQEKRKNDVFLIIIFAVLLVTAVAVEIDKLFNNKPDLQWARYITSITGYTLRPAILVMMIILLQGRLKNNFLFWVPLIINAMFYLSAPITHLTFYFENGEWREGPLDLMMVIVCIIYAVILLCVMYQVFISVSIKELILIIADAALTIIGGLLDKLYTENGGLFLSSLAVSVTIYYYYMHIQNSKERDMERVETINDNKKEIEKKNAELMISQIQPHFLYNTLSSVKFLIKDNPKLAEETLDKFSLFLRGNMEAIGKDEPVTFDMELEHVENYVFIEKTRFPYITVEYDIEDDIFDLPALSIQPLVENAIKHGIRGKKDGYVRIKTYYDDGNHIVEISDNGVGFDPETANMHVGIENVQKRLKMMVDGQMEIKSVIGEGTLIKLIIPESDDIDFDNVI